MAKRCYFSSAVAAPVTVVPDAWGSTAGSLQRLLLGDKNALEALTTGTTISFAALSTGLDRVFVSNPLAAQTFSGTAQCQVVMREGATSDDATPRISIRIVSADGGTVRGTLLALGNYGTGLELTASFQNRIVANAAALTPVAVQAGDRLVVEIGYGALVSGVTPQGIATWGAPSGSTDATSGNQTEGATVVPWIEFSHDFDNVFGGVLPVGRVVLYCPPPFRVLLASPIGSNQLRVYLSERPRAFSPLSANDVLNRLNWEIVLVAGEGGTPVLESVENPQPRPEFPEHPDAWSVDISVDRRLLNASQYLIIASPAISAVSGMGMVASPCDRWTFDGISLPRDRRLLPLPATAGGIDYEYDTFLGAFVRNARNDIAVHGGLAYLTKRIIRRLISTKGRFAHLPQYGVGLRTKELVNTTRLNDLAREAEDQIRQEDDVLEAKVTATSLAVGAIVLRIQVRSSFGNLSLNMEANEDGGIFVL